MDEKASREQRSGAWGGSSLPAPPLMWPKKLITDLTVRGDPRTGLQGSKELGPVFHTGGKALAPAPRVVCLSGFFGYKDRNSMQTSSAKKKKKRNVAADNPE